MGKKGGGKKKKEKKAENPLANLSLEEQVNARTIEWKALQQLLINETEAADRERAGENELRSKTLILSKDLEEERKISWDVTCDMTRQFKSMQQEKDEKIQELQEKISAVQLKILQRDSQFKDIEKEKDQILKEKEDDMRELKRRVDDMSQNFAAMLKDTLEKMKEKIEFVNKSWKDEMEAPMMQKLQDFAQNK